LDLLLLSASGGTISGLTLLLLQRLLVLLVVVVLLLVAVQVPAALLCWLLRSAPGPELPPGALCDSADAIRAGMRPAAA
jgi:hypothetical protein